LTPCADWDHFPIFLPDHLKSNLKYNHTIVQPFRTATAPLFHSEALCRFLSDLFALTPHTAPAFDDWDQSASYCIGCFTEFVEEHLWIWFREERMKGTVSAYPPSA
jgi:hypothetical protein